MSIWFSLILCFVAFAVPAIIIIYMPIKYWTDRFGRCYTFFTITLNLLAMYNFISVMRNFIDVSINK